jgi:ATP-dependent Zn protease
MMGGRVGEEMMLGEENVATGAVSDFQQATNIATQIVKSWGMSDKAGVRTYGEVSLTCKVG